MNSAADSAARQWHPSPQTAADRFYRPELDLLRFVAFLSVFTVHAFSASPDTVAHQDIIAPVGAYGLCLFFFLSSYLITELLCRETASAGTVHIRAFYLRRVLRIWPLYFAFLLFAKILGHFVPFFTLENSRFVAFSLLAGNFYLARFGGSWTPAEPLWSISLEEQFYLAWPVVAWLGGRRALGVCSALLLPLAWVTLYWHSGYQPAAMGLEFDGTVWCSSLVQFQFFALGALASIFLRGKLMRMHTPIRWSAFCAGLGLWLAASCLFRLPRFHDHLPGVVLVSGYSLIAAGCVLLFLSVLGASGRLPRPLIYLGRISYGLYVFHWLFLELVYIAPNIQAGEFVAPHNSLGSFATKFVLALAGTVLAATLSYRQFEMPFLKLKKRFTWVPSRVP